ncbi:hypothetical protein TRFO_19158 [Tritrichomonas foetus]|uniref:Uncharacterized protein n=1 Tax=Tritrichomonas foetus TaxID=1144522 RepID=A0A1J4KKG8_9EUKA|nr:hypothetical protein TRFO_19158 [Tritrichomonas foetus]|eukprot:OHT11424.1 hypothetical protein TRFO_19158 [Tritrichomonas foetus]
MEEETLYETSNDEQESQETFEENSKEEVFNEPKVVFQNEEEDLNDYFREEEEENSTDELLNVLYHHSSASPSSVKKKKTQSFAKSNKTLITTIPKYNITRPLPDNWVTKLPPEPRTVVQNSEVKPVQYNGIKGFIERQSKSNQHRIEVRSQTPTIRGFDPPLYTPPEIEYLPNDYKWVSPQHKDDYVTKTPSTPYLEDLFKHSIKKPRPAPEEPLPEISRVNKCSIQIANERNQEIINGIVGQAKIINEKRFISIMRKFNISNNPEPNDPITPRPLICKVKDVITLGEDQFDAVKLKELLITASSGECSGLSGALRPTVNAAMSNMKPGFICPRKSSRSAQGTPRSQKTGNSQTPTSQKKTPNSTPKSASKATPKSSSKTTPMKEQSSEDYLTSIDSEESKKPSRKSSDSAKKTQRNTTSNKHAKSRIESNPSKTESQQQSGQKKTRKTSDLVDYEFKEPENISVQNTPNKSRKPKRSSPKGAKYFPGFYDNLDFYVTKSPARH